MTLRLILMRHAKSSWDDPLQDDIDRPLNERGHRNALMMGHWLEQNGYVPDQALVSAAARTRETFERVQVGLRKKPEARILDELYLASDLAILRTLQRATGQTVLVVGHNPGIAEFASRFAARGHARPKFDHYPTCATTVFNLGSTDWSEAKYGENPVIDFAVPREIEAAGSVVFRHHPEPTK
ncbi:SixA phosphatase family protein [Celeribacter litoreus]|uniref:SixA phosphatase family protein n=1 Tax=Celeribacter litoreus TaxID=2876714 RepID=UPI001CCCE403|nr:histidine phosphatase family protein [Celeribacter litoreus]MCA0042458.1 histidine phosphatase family protein [Celeribacter litoreus]